MDAMQIRRIVHH